MAITLPGGFSITNNEPADARIAVASSASRLTLSTANVYEGLLSFEQSTDQLFVLKDATAPSSTGSWEVVNIFTITGSQYNSPYSIGITGSLNISNSLVVTGDATISGDLKVSGTSSAVNTTNLTVTDKFILVNSGSNTASDNSGLVFGGSEGTLYSGSSLFWNGAFNSNDGRVAVASGVASTSTTATPGYYMAGVISGSENEATGSQVDHYGNIRIESGDIYIYV